MTQENHQDYICMTMITARTAMLAAVFFIFNLGHPDGQQHRVSMDSHQR